MTLLESPFHKWNAGGQKKESGSPIFPHMSKSIEKGNYDYSKKVSMSHNICNRREKKLKRRGGEVRVHGGTHNSLN